MTATRKRRTSDGEAGQPQARTEQREQPVERVLHASSFDSFSVDLEGSA
jgi:hypothetical protein